MNSMPVNPREPSAGYPRIRARVRDVHLQIWVHIPSHSRTGARLARRRAPILQNFRDRTNRRGPCGTYVARPLRIFRSF